MPKRLDLSGKTFHALTVLEFAEVRSGRSHWRCLCECGAEAVVDGSKLTNGHTRSCGCLQRKQSAEWAESLGVDRRKIHKRLKLGWSAEKALTIA